jgi:hypothetical protein
VVEVIANCGMYGDKFLKGELLPNRWTDFVVI